MHDGYRRIGQFQARVESGYLGVVPFGYLLQVDVCQDIAGELELPRADTGQVIDDGNCAAGHGYVQNRAMRGFRLGLLVSGHDAVAGAKVNGAFRNLGDAAAGTNGLIVYLYPGEFVVLIKPFGV